MKFITENEKNSVTFEPHHSLGEYRKMEKWKEYCQDIRKGITLAVMGT